MPLLRTHDLSPIRPSVLDLALANEATLISQQVGQVTVSLEDSLGSNHTTLSLNIYTLDDIALHPSPAPSGYKVEPKHKDACVREFAMSLPQCLPYTLDHSTAPLVQESLMSAPVMTAHAAREMFDTMIERACKSTLK